MNTIKNLLCISVMSGLALCVDAQDFCVNNLYYNILSESEKTCEVTTGWNEDGPIEYTGIISVPSTVTYNGKKYTVTAIGEWAFATIREAVYNSPTFVSIPNTVTTIKEKAFYGISSLTSLTIPKSVTTIEDQAFAFAELTAFKVNADNSKYCSIDGILIEKENSCLIQYPLAKRGTVKIPDSIKKIGSYAFAGCYCNEMDHTITIPYSVSEIGEYVFAKSGFKNFIFQNSLESLPIGTFSCCTIESICWPRNLKDIGGAFDGDASWGLRCTKIKDLVIPEGVTSFGGITACDINTLTIPEGVEQAPDLALCNIQTVNLPSTIKHYGIWRDANIIGTINIAYGASFLGNFYLEDAVIDKLVIPSTISTIGKIESYIYWSINSIYNYSPNPQNLEYSTFSEIKDNCTLHVLKGYKSRYQYASGWRDFTIVDDLEPNQITEIKFDKDIYYVAIDEVGQIETLVKPFDATITELDWSSSDPSVVLVDENGHFAGLEIGNAVITAKAKDGSNTAAMTTVIVWDGEKSSRCATPELTFSNGKLGFKCSTEGAKIHVNSCLKAIDLETITAGCQYPLQLTVTYYATAEGLVPSESVTTDIDLSPGLFGDINGDGELDVSDPVALSKLILERY